MMRCRKARVRSSCGDSKICAGGPSSRIMLPSREGHAVGDLAGEAHFMGDDHSVVIPSSLRAAG